MISRAKVLKSWAETPTTHVIRIEKPRGFDYEPVQFCGLELETTEGGIEYPMSIACSPTKPYVEFGARVTSGSPWKRAFAALEPGDEVEIDGAYGHFVLDTTRPAILIGGGIGITPLKGMLEYATDKKLPIDVRLLYSSRDEAEIAFQKDIDAAAEANPLARVTYTLTRPTHTWTGKRGRIDEAMVREAARGLGAPAYYICGLPEMVSDMARLVLGMGVPRERVTWEQFHGYE